MSTIFTSTMHFLQYACNTLNSGLIIFTIFLFVILEFQDFIPIKIECEMLITKRGYFDFDASQFLWYQNHETWILIIRLIFICVVWNNSWQWNLNGIAWADKNSPMHNKVVGVKLQTLKRATTPIEPITCIIASFPHHSVQHSISRRQAKKKNIVF